jgi:chemotaxis protein CheD
MPFTRRYTVGIGEFALSSQAGEIIVTHALGSCVAVTLWDPETRVAGLLHFLLPDANLGGDRASRQPTAFANPGIPIVLEAAAAMGFEKKRSAIFLVGGASVGGAGGTSVLDIGRRNVLAARSTLWRCGALVKGEVVGGAAARTVWMNAADGRVQVTHGHDLVAELP